MRSNANDTRPKAVILSRSEESQNSDNDGLLPKALVLNFDGSHLEILRSTLRMTGRVIPPTIDVHVVLPLGMTGTGDVPAIAAGPRICVWLLSTSTLRALP